MARYAGGAWVSTGSRNISAKEEPLCDVKRVDAT